MHLTRRLSSVPLILAATLSIGACSPQRSDIEDPLPGCQPNNGGIELPDGFCAVVVADEIGRARHLAVAANNDIYVALRNTEEGGGIAALRDTTGDGVADDIRYFGDLGGTGVKVRGQYLYFSHDTTIIRYDLTSGDLVPEGPPETIVSDFPRQGSHAVKPVEFDDAGNMYVNIGAPSNACQNPTRTPGVAGQDPCPILEQYGGTWRFSADVPGQKPADGTLYASGIRNGMANAWNPTNKTLYVAQHGRDQLNALWPDLFDEQSSAELPSEELFEVNEGDHFGWPYCYYDHLVGRKVLAPEYGGDGTAVDRCAEFKDPIVGFPGHWAPNDMMFYTGNQFPERYHGGAFIAFHGSWNRAPLPQAGYNVAFVPFSNGASDGTYEVFADGFSGSDRLVSPRDATHRPTGLAEGADGSVYVSDGQVGRIWRIMYVGE